MTKHQWIIDRLENRYVSENSNQHVSYIYKLSSFNQAANLSHVRLSFKFNDS